MQIVDAVDERAPLDETLAEMRPDEAGATSHNDDLSLSYSHPLTLRKSHRLLTRISSFSSWPRFTPHLLDGHEWDCGCVKSDRRAGATGAVLRHALSEEDLAVQRAGWIGMALVVVAAFAGLFSNGPASWTVAENIDGVVSVHHQRFLRAGATTQMQMHASPEAVQDRPFVLILDPAFLKALTTVSLMIIVDNGRPLRERMRNARVEDEDVLESARRLHDLDCMNQSNLRCWRSAAGSGDTKAE